MFTFKRAVSCIKVHSIIRMTLEVATSIGKLYHLLNLDHLL